MCCSQTPTHRSTTGAALALTSNIQHGLCMNKVKRREMLRQRVWDVGEVTLPPDELHSEKKALMRAGTVTTGRLMNPTGFHHTCLTCPLLHIALFLPSCSIIQQLFVCLFIYPKFMYSMHAQISSRGGKRERLSEAWRLTTPPAAGRGERRKGRKEGD